jgi:hypothetical protein
MKNAKREDVRMKAADSILNHLKRPDAAKVLVNVDLSDTKEVNDLREMMRKMAQDQQTLISMGHTTKSIAHQGLKDVTPN